jgi:hypothetical protein
MAHIHHLWVADLGNIGQAWWMDTEQRYETQRIDSDRHHTWLFTRPQTDLKQVVAQIITSQKSALPIWLEVLSGNSSDKGGFADSVTSYCKSNWEMQFDRFLRCGIWVIIYWRLTFQLLR